VKSAKVHRRTFERGALTERESGAVDISGNYLSEKFKNVTGVNFVEYVARPLEKVCDLLENVDRRISEIAFAIGFQSLSQFNRIFKKLSGRSPTQYRDRAGKATAANSSTGVKMSLNICSYYVTNNPVRQMRAIGVVRLLLVLVMGISWFVLANHCVLAVAVARAQAPAHNCCGTDKAGDRAPAKERQGGGECCKTLDVTLVPAVKNLTGLYCWSVLPAYLIAPVTLADAAQSTQSATELDTGPPCASSFAETVLQRSILVHAPPSLA
jgi:AraC-like DNA-binding protein